MHDRTPERLLEEAFAPLAGVAVVGVVAGVVGPAGTQWRAWGRSGVRALALDDRTVFEIGSVTKVVTATLLAALVHDGTVSLDDPLDRWVPDAVPRRGPVPTLRSLAAHTSGLPRVGRGMLGRALRNPADPYARTQFDELVRAVRRESPEPGAVVYSNLGYALLGGALANAAGLPFPDLATRRVLAPLGLADTTFGVPDHLAERVAEGHGGRRRRRVPPWNLGAFTPSGGLRSTARDLLALLRAELDPDTAPLRAAIELTRTEGLGWHTRAEGGRPVHWHDGGTGGFAAFVAYDADAGSGVVALANTATVPALPLHDAGFAVVRGLGP